MRPSDIQSNILNTSENLLDFDDNIHNADILESVDVEDVDIKNDIKDDDLLFDDENEQLNDDLNDSDMLHLVIMDSNEIGPNDKQPSEVLPTLKDK